MNKDLTTFAVILAGGSGTRFWPLSRETYPKQLLKIFGDQTLIQATLSRIAPLIPADQIYIVTNPQQEEQIRFQLQAPSPGFITEPIGRNTAAAIGLAAMTLSKKDPNGIMVVLSADHFIRDERVLLEQLRLGREIASQGYLVTIGAKPTRPETAYGYIQTGEALPDFQGAERAARSGFARSDAGGDGIESVALRPPHRVVRFFEKPDREKASLYLQSKDFYWNTGMFIWKIATILEEINRFMPALAKGLKTISEQGAETIKEVYSHLPSISIDYGILEKSDKLAVIPAEMGWEDVGSWNALDEILPKNEAGNILIGNVVNVGCNNSIIYANSRVIAAVGLDDIVVADTDDATLICSKGKAQEVKQVVEILKTKKGEEHRVHRTVIRPWGSYTVLEEGLGYKLKRIMVHPKSRLSLQSHTKRSEHWVVVAGTARVTCGESVYTIGANQSTFVPMGVKHRLENPMDEPLQIIEVQCGGYLGEDDIARYADDFGRAAPAASGITGPVGAVKKVM
ncbi:MAG: mannose-1-phosphate guanylyltransferase/mannose-6-phosphate isomerase [Nitrospirae bacterium]|nr:mannose-1-phosphate guanylyltransferase/mannose-6-phosphate isomerase [Candidatus Troglogloeales bacterium]